MDLLDTYLSNRFPLPYLRGVNDCALFVAVWADLLTGAHHAERIAGQYKTHFEGLRKFARDGVCEAVASELLAAGWEEVIEWQRGDIVTTDIKSPGIWTGDRIVTTAAGASGLTYLHHRHLSLAFRRPAAAIS